MLLVVTVVAASLGWSISARRLNEIEPSIWHLKLRFGNEFSIPSPEQYAIWRVMAVHPGGDASTVHLPTGDNYSLRLSDNGINWCNFPSRHTELCTLESGVHKIELACSRNWDGSDQVRVYCDEDLIHEERKPKDWRPDGPLTLHLAERGINYPRLHSVLQPLTVVRHYSSVPSDGDSHGFLLWIESDLSATTEPTPKEGGDTEKIVAFQATQR